MSTSSEDVIQYVDHLEGDDDYWMSITDAARVCRVQDVSIRRAIAKGRLPVRSTNAGDNKRTRFVRASDLPRAGFPIIDSSAAITSDIRKVDFLNIPKQQQELAKQHEQLATHHHEMMQAIDDRFVDVHQSITKQRDHTNRRVRELHTELIESQAQSLEELKAHFSSQIHTLQHEFTEQYNQLSSQLTSLHTQTEHLTTRLKQVEQVQQAMQEAHTQHVKDTQAFMQDMEQRILDQINQRAKKVDEQLAHLTEELGLTVVQQKLDGKEVVQLKERFERMDTEFDSYARSDYARDQRVFELGKKVYEFEHKLLQLTVSKVDPSSSFKITVDHKPCLQHAIAANERF